MVASNQGFDDYSDFSEQILSLIDKKGNKFLSRNISVGIAQSFFNIVHITINK